MFMSVLSGLIVSVDAFFIGLSLGLQKRCKFMYLAAINAVLMGLCFLGFMAAGRVYEHIGFDTGLVVGLVFIALGLWCIGHYFICEGIKRRRGSAMEGNTSVKTIVIVGLVMSVEAMLITMGITFIFHAYSTMFIPLTIGLAHFGYSALSFCLARTRQVRRIPAIVSHIVSGGALIIYGVMAIFI